MGGGRAHDYGVGVTRDESTTWVNSNVLVIPMVEEVRAVENLDQILAVPGADVLHVAASDLGQSMGFPPVSEVRRVMGEVIPRVRAAGKNVGVGGNNPGRCRRRGRVHQAGGQLRYRVVAGADAAGGG